MRRSASKGRMCRSRRNSRIASIRIWSPSGSSTYRSGCARRSTRPRTRSLAMRSEAVAALPARPPAPPSSAPANPSAARRFPTPGGPWNRYACAGPSARAASSRRRASACSGKPWKPVTHLLRNLVRGRRGVEHRDPARKRRAQLPVGLVHLAQELVALALDPVTGRPRAALSLLGIDERQEGHVGKDASNRVHVQGEHAVDAEPARDSLVRARRIEVAIADDVSAPLQCGLDHLRDELRAGRREECRLGPGRDLGPAEDELADPLPDLGPAGLTR